MSTKTTAPTLSPLAQRVNDHLAAEDDYLVSAGHFGPGKGEDECLTMFELDLIDWGLTVGLAYGVARAEDPFERVQSVVERAAQAARAAYARWASFDGMEATQELLNGKAYAQDRRERPVSPESAPAIELDDEARYVLERSIYFDRIAESVQGAHDADDLERRLRNGIEIAALMRAHETGFLPVSSVEWAARVVGERMADEVSDLEHERERVARLDAGEKDSGLEECSEGEIASLREWIAELERLTVARPAFLTLIGAEQKVAA